MERRICTFIQNVASKFKTAVWSNRFGAFHSDLNDSSIRSGYFQNLEMFRRLAYSTNRPWWGIIDGTYFSKAISDQNEYQKYLIIVKNRIQFEIHSMLTFGAQGIGWKRYYSEKNTEFPYCWAPLNNSISTNQDLYDFATKINTEINFLSEVFLGGSVRECRFTQSGTLTNGFTIGIGSAMNNLIGFKNNTTGGKGFLLSRILNHGCEYYIVMNVDPTLTQSATVTFGNSVDKIPLSESAGSAVPLKTETFTLTSGEWRIYRNKLFKDVTL